MKSYSFIAYGHPNIIATHKTTLEITKENFLTKKGDCIIGVNADFDFKKLKIFIKNFNGDFVEIELKTDGLTEKIKGKLNKNFNDKNSIVIRKSDFVSSRTLVFGADRAALNLDKEFVGLLIKRGKLVTISLRKIE